MKLRILITTLALSGAAGFTATSAQAQAASPCETYKCVAGLSGYGTSPGPDCAPALKAFFKIAVFNPPLDANAASTEHTFDSEATAAERKKYLMTCPEAAADSNASTLTAIIDKWTNVK